MRTSSAAPSDQPASSSGLMNGPLEENARADATARTRPDVLTRRTGSAPMTGRDAVGAAMAESGCLIGLSGVKCVYTSDTTGHSCQESTWCSFVTRNSRSRLPSTSSTPSPATTTRTRCAPWTDLDAYLAVNPYTGTIRRDEAELAAVRAHPAAAAPALGRRPRRRGAAGERDAARRPRPPPPRDPRRLRLAHPRDLRRRAACDPHPGGGGDGVRRRHPLGRVRPRAGVLGATTATPSTSTTRATGRSATATPATAATA